MEPLDFEIDIFPETLGEYYLFNELNSLLCHKIFCDIGGSYRRQYLLHHGFVPKNLMKRINRATQSRFEYGLDGFWWSLASSKSRINFRTKHENMKEDTDSMLQVLGLKQLSMFFVLYAVQISIAIVVFISEMIYGRNEEEEIAPVIV